MLLWMGQKPKFEIIELTPNVAMTIGREKLLGSQPLLDDQVSRNHADIAFDGKQFQLTDKDSRNGTFVNGAKIKGTVAFGPGTLIRVGRTVLRSIADLRPLKGALMSTDNNYVVGPTLRSVLDRLQRSATGGANVLIIGENGTGKEKAAGAFHKAATPRGKLISVNCATLNAATADSQLFGSAAKTYTGVQGGPGLIEAADGGTLFLDEVGELPLETQAKLLRAVENGETMRAGEVEPRKVTVRYVCATNRDVKQQVASGKFREDLYYRLAAMVVQLPPLRERLEEAPYLIHQEIEPHGRVAHHELVEAVLLRAWPGNVRELLNAIRTARLHAKHEILVRKEDLEVPPEVSPRPVNQTGNTIAFKEVEAPKTKEELEAVLQRHGGNKSAAAEELGMHRTQFYRLLKKYGLLDPGDSGSGES
ncbi:MAG: sigma 54-interacting transcriptional regulator [Myxococcaceae bacterium]